MAACRGKGEEVRVTAEGIRLSQSSLWLDAIRPKELGFVSHGHLRGGHKRIIATPLTLRLLRGATYQRSSHLPLAPGQAVELGGLGLEVLPAGHVPGAVQLMIERQGRRILYTGHFNTDSSSLVEPAKARFCDLLILDSTRCVPHAPLPPRRQVTMDILAFVRQALRDGRVPALLADPLGKSQELLALLGAEGMTVRLHGAIYHVTRALREGGLNLPLARRAQGPPREGEVWLLPLGPQAQLPPGVEDAALALVSGAAQDSPLPLAATFPLSDHADLDQTVSYARAVGPEAILTTGPWRQELAERLVDEGFGAKALSSPEQLGLL